MNTRCLVAAVLLLAAAAVAAEPAGTNWTVRRPSAIRADNDGGVVLDDGSVRMNLPSPVNSDVTLRFDFEMPANVRRVRVEVLPDPRFDDRRLGRRTGKELRLFEVVAALAPAEGKSRRLDWSSCRNPNDPDNPELPHCIDAASDTGYALSPLKATQTSHVLVFEWEAPVAIPTGGRFDLTLESGGSPTLDTLARFRVSFDEK